MEVPEVVFVIFGASRDALLTGALEQIGEIGFYEPPWCQRVHVGVSLNLGGVEEEFPTFYQSGLDAKSYDLLEETAEDLHPVAFSELG